MSTVGAAVDLQVARPARLRASRARAARVRPATPTSARTAISPSAASTAAPFQVIPGYVLGEGSHTFPVRGFPSGTLIGTRVHGLSRISNSAVLDLARAPGTLPLLPRPGSLALFGDYGTAWCPEHRDGPRGVQRRRDQS